MSRPSDSFAQRLWQGLEAPWIGKLGNLWTIVTFAILGFGVLRWAILHELDLMTLAVLALGVAAMAINVAALLRRPRLEAVEPPAVSNPGPPPSPPAPAIPDPGSAPQAPSGGGPTDEEERRQRLDERIEAELVALVDDWRCLRGSEFSETGTAAYGFLRERTGTFIEAVLGRAARQKFESNGTNKPPTFNAQADLRIQALEDLRDHPEHWKAQADFTGVEEAASTRKEISYSDAILIADSPLRSRYEIPRTAEEAIAKEVVVTEEPDLKSALRSERADGYKLLNAMKGGVVALWKYDRVPSAKDVASWQANVEYLLRDEPHLLHLFCWQPIGTAIGLSIATIADTLSGGPEARRLEQSLGQLDKVIDKF